MSVLDLSKYGIPNTFDLLGEFLEFPATTVDPLQAPVVLLVDENHSAVNEPSVKASATDVGQIVKAIPDTIVVLEHFLVGTLVTATTPRTHGGSRFHIFLHQIVQANTIGGDDAGSLEMFADITGDYEVRVFDEPDEAEKARLTEEGRIKVREHPEQFTRSKSVIGTLLLKLASSNKRLGVINAGANHNNHILTNPTHNGKPVCAARSTVSFIRLRPVEELRRMAAYLNWIYRGRPLWQELVDWEMAEQSIPRLSP